MTASCCTATIGIFSTFRWKWIHSTHNTVAISKVSMEGLHNVSSLAAAKTRDTTGHWSLVQGVQPIYPTSPYTCIKVRSTSHVNVGYTNSTEAQPYIRHVLYNDCRYTCMYHIHSASLVTFPHPTSHTTSLTQLHTSTYIYLVHECTCHIARCHDTSNQPHLHVHPILRH